jgi:DNA topoisomerase-3
VPTPLGIGLIEALPVKSLASPELTGTWEARLARVARGEETRAAFMADISRYVREVVDAIRRAPAAGSPPAEVARARPPGPPPAGAPRERPASASPAAAPRKRPPAKAPAADALACPRCRAGTLVAGRRGWGCSRWREGCAFVIWFDVAGRRITDKELAELVAKGKTRRRKWPTDAGGERAARLVLDLEAPREAGAARLE